MCTKLVIIYTDDWQHLIAFLISYISSVFHCFFLLKYFSQNILVSVHYFIDYKQPKILFSITFHFFLSSMRSTAQNEYIVVRYTCCIAYVISYVCLVDMSYEHLSVCEYVLHKCVYGSLLQINRTTTTSLPSSPPQVLLSKYLS